MSEPTKKKSEGLAFILNALLAGAGFGYLGLWKYAILNLIGVLAIGIGLALFLPEQFMIERGNTIALVLGVMSGSLAMEFAKDMNKRRDSEMAQRIDDIGRED